MFRNFNLVVGVFALILFCYVQHQGWNMFDNEAESHVSGSHGSGRVYHK